MENLKYKEQNSTMTLREGLKEYQESFKTDISDTQAMDVVSADFFHKHDITHVVFGLDTSLKEEAMVDYWTIFGTDLPVKIFIQALDTEEEKKLMKEIGCWTITKTFVGTIPHLVKIVLSSSKMKKKWSWNNYGEYLDKPLNEIREEHNIRLL